MANINVWSKVAVAVQTALAPADTITGITKANPAVVSAAAHGMINGTYVLLKITGMRQLDYKVVRIAGVTTDAYQLEGVDSTLFDDFVSGTSEAITFGAQASTFQDVNASGGEAAAIGISTIHDDQDFEIPGNRSPMVFNFGSLWDPADPALVALKGFDERKTPGACMLTFATGARILLAAYFSAGLAPTGSSGQPVTTPVSFRLRGRLTTYTS